MDTVRSRRIAKLYEDLRRCEREIGAIERAEQNDAPAFLVTLGLEDWKREKSVIEREILSYGD